MARCCEFANVCGAISALILSIVGIALSLSGQGPMKEALDGAGKGAESLATNCSSLGFNYIVVFVLNAVCTLIVCLSTFDCSHLSKHALFHDITSSTSLCWCRILAWITFMVQLLMSQLFMVALVLVSFLSYVCNTGEGVIYQTQELIYAIGNTTSPTSTLYNPYGQNVANVTDTPVVSIKMLLSTLDMNRYCGYEQDVTGAAMHFWVGCFITAMSQALMAVALNGEKERVSVHELHDADDTWGSAYRDGAQMGEHLMSAAAGHANH